MNRLVKTLSAERKILLAGFGYLIGIGLILLAQNVIRYGHHERYDSWPTIRYLLLGLVLFIFVLPGYLQWVRRIEKIRSLYWVGVSIAIMVATLCFYAASSGLLYLLQVKESFFSESYARFYFGRIIVFHILLLLLIAFYFLHVKKVKTDKQISGTFGRKKITINAHLIRWIEADGHYLRIYFNEGTILKRSTLDQMTQELAPDFIRIHRKYLVNKKQVVGKEKNKRAEFLILSTGERIKVGRSYLPLNL